MRRLAATVAALFCVCAAPASASDAEVVGDVLTITGTPTSDTISLAPAGAGVILVEDPAGLAAGPGCVQGGVTDATCSVVNSVSATLDAGNDVLTADQTLPQPITALGGAGNEILIGGAGNDVLDGQAGLDLINGVGGDDRVTGGPDDDVLSGGNGRDRIFGNDDHDFLSGGNGDDHLEGGDGEDALAGDDDGDELDGGDGDDSLAGGEDNDLLDGGQGADAIEGDRDRDRVTYQRRTNPVTVTLGNARDDGEAGEGDEVGITVEDVTGGAGNDLIVGTSFDNELDGRAGNDTINPFTGSDLAIGGAGDDAIDLRDDAADRASCGDGADTVDADERDAADADCETVRLPQPPAEPVAPPPAAEPRAPGTTIVRVPVLSVARPRATPRVTLRVGPRRDRRAPYAFTVSGRLTLPAGLSPALACADTGLVAIEVRRGRQVLLTMRPRVRANCTFSARASFRGPRRVRATALRFTAAFMGNAYLSPRRARSVTARLGQGR